MLFNLLESPRPIKRLYSITYDSIAIALSLWLAWALRDGSIGISPTPNDWFCLAATLVISIATFTRLGLYRAVLRFMATDAIVTVLAGMIISSFALTTCQYLFSSSIPKAVPAIYFLSATLAIGLPRLLVRNIVQLYYPLGDTKVLIYGAGSAGRMLADSLRQSSEFRPVAFIDDDLRLSYSNIKGLTVHPGNQVETLLHEHKCSQIFLALGAVPRSARLRIIRNLERFNVKIQTIPPLEELTRGAADIGEIRDIQIEDLLGRDPVLPRAFATRCEHCQ